MNETTRAEGTVRPLPGREPTFLPNGPGRDPAEIKRTGRRVAAELASETNREYAAEHGLRSDHEVAVHMHAVAGVRPAEPERYTNRRGVPSARVLMILNQDDLLAFQDLCDLEWGGVTYREGFRRLLELGGVTPGGPADRSEGSDRSGPSDRSGNVPTHGATS